MGVKASERQKGIGEALLLTTLYAMREDGYAYAIIGSVGSAYDFYQKSIDIIKIEDHSHSVYSRML